MNNAISTRAATQASRGRDHVPHAKFGGTRSLGLSHAQVAHERRIGEKEGVDLARTALVIYDSIASD